MTVVMRRKLSVLKKIGKRLRGYRQQRLLFAVAISYIFILILSLSVFFGGENSKLSAICIAAIVLYIPAVLLSELLVRVIRARSISLKNFEYPVSDNSALDVLTRIQTPVLIFDDSGSIVWFNRSFSACCGVGDSLYGRSFEKVCGIQTEDVITPESDSGFECTAFGRQWEIKGHRTGTGSKNYTMTFWNDRSEIVSVYRQLNDETAVVAYIMIDNLDELMQYVQEQYRTVVGQVESVLKKWAESVGGIFKEYERERYIFIFEAAHVREFIENKFDILDRVRNIKIGEGNMPVTISIGISSSFGGLADKDRAARNALDMALQRGGDQVVVRADSGLEFYGGRSKGVSKRTKVRARVVANALAVAISKSSNVIIMGHKNADFDSLGSCVGVARLAMFCGVKVNIVINEKDPNLKKALSRLRSNPEYLSIFSNAADAQDMITSETLLVVCDVNNREKFESPEIADNIFNMVVIDHHRKTAEYARNPIITYIEPSASSACELVVEILEQSIPAGTLPKDEADIMFAGILLDTKQFSRNTHTRTFSAALYLRGEGAEPADIEQLFKTDLDDFIREAKFETDVEIYRSVIAISMNVNNENSPFDRVAAAKAADKLLSVEGVEASFAVCCVDDYVHISARSEGSVNVQLIVEKIGGGGRFDVAATQLYGVTPQQARKMLTDAIDSYLDGE